jgi:hypothetical protein
VATVPQALASPTSITWKHVDPDLGAQVKAALALRSRPGADPREAFRKMSSSERVRFLRALSIGTLLAIEDSRVGGIPPLGEMDTALTLGRKPVRADQFATPGHLYAASMLARAPMMIGDPGKHMVYSAETREGDPAALDTKGPSAETGGGTDTGLAPILVGVAIVATTGVLGIAICYCGQLAAEVVDRKLADDALTARMVMTQASASDLVMAHTAREQAAGGAPIPYDAGELKVLDMLGGAYVALAKRDRSPIPNPFAGAVKSAGRAVENAASGVGFGLVVALAAAGALYAASRAEAAPAEH